jgi:hypothetical protein
MLNDEQLFSYLFEKIICRIQKEKRMLNLKRRLAFFSVGLLGSITAFIPTFHLVQHGLAESGFIKFFSLLFSDIRTVMSYWQNFVFALLESLPIVSIAALLATIFVFLESVKFLVQDIRVILAPIKNYNN